MKVGYVRLSRDEDKENYTSIINQQDIINEYAYSKKINIDKIYIDDNYSGYNFERPAFNEMMREIKNGNIDTVITKDLSRIGRNNGKVLVFIDQMIEQNIRVIFVTEAEGGYDILEDDSDIIGIKTWYNEMYIKDISRKIRASMHSQLKSGTLIMGNPYGYKKIKVNGRHELVVDEKLRPAIELIFKAYIGGMGYLQICGELDKRGYPTPSRRLKDKHEEDGRIFKNKTCDFWQTHVIQRIIKDEVYIGHLRTGKRHAKTMKGKSLKVPKDKQNLFEDHHEAIISKEDFELAQAINYKRQEVNYQFRKNKYAYIFSSFMRCNHCGYNMLGTKLYNKEQSRGYQCSRYRKYGTRQCVDNKIPEAKVLFYFNSFLRDVRDKYKTYINTIDLNKTKKNTEENIKILEKDIKILENELKLLYNQKIKDIIKESNVEYKNIIENSYNELEQEKKDKISLLKKELDNIKNINVDDIKNKITSAIEKFDAIIEADRPDRKLLELVLDKIYLSDNGQLEFKLLINIDNLTQGK